MSTASPSAFLVWAILSVVFFMFLGQHLWSYDRFSCLKWNSGRQPGAFKRIMTYSYLTSVPLMVIFSIAMTFIKFQEGYIMLPDSRVIPKPVELYSKTQKHWLLPLYFAFSAAWALELITHLEELTFWLFMLHQHPGKSQWFTSWEYRFWYLGSIVAITGLPVTAAVTRFDIQKCDAWIILVGSSAATVTTLVFFYVLWEFPMFLKHVKSEGADPNVVVQLHTFYQLNLARIFFRLLFTLPLLILSIDAIMSGRHPVNRNSFWTDFLFMLGGFGCFFSSAMTLLIFFPRSFTSEAGYTARIATPPTTPALPTSRPITPKSVVMDFNHTLRHPLSDPDITTHVSVSARVRNFRSLDLETASSCGVPPYDYFEGAYPAVSRRSVSIPPPQLRRMSSLHPYVATFTSPIDLFDIPTQDEWPQAL